MPTHVARAYESIRLFKARQREILGAIEISLATLNLIWRALIRLASSSIDPWLTKLFNISVNMSIVSEYPRSSYAVKLMRDSLYSIKYGILILSARPTPCCPRNFMSLKVSYGSRSRALMLRTICSKRSLLQFQCLSEVEYLTELLINLDISAGLDEIWDSIIPSIWYASYFLSTASPDLQIPNSFTFRAWFVKSIRNWDIGVSDARCYVYGWDTVRH